jgi:predicted protein tyrosine phosphatase
MAMLNNQRVIIFDIPPHSLHMAVLCFDIPQMAVCGKGI